MPFNVRAATGLAHNQIVQTVALLVVAWLIGLALFIIGAWETMYHVDLSDWWSDRR